MTRWISLPIDEGNKLSLAVGDVRRIRLTDGEEFDAVFEAGPGSSLYFFRADDDGEPTGDGLDDVAAVQLPEPRKSGATQTEEARIARGMRQLKLRVNESVIARLDALVATANGTRSEFVSALIDSETARATRRKNRQLDRK